jgi:hypothetical protein
MKTNRLREFAARVWHGCLSLTRSCLPAFFLGGKLLLGNAPSPQPVAKSVPDRILAVRAELAKRGSELRAPDLQGIQKPEGTEIAFWVDWANWANWNNWNNWANWANWANWVNY